ncbi:hypothetical protein MMC10_005144 [Thelotrema lepadinum]|nr:hypothetical protein [Thelotrema lepadinum]
MPNISFDIFFNEDTVNITATRGDKAPKVKPEWKVRSAPKLPPKTPPQKPVAAFANPSKAKAAQESAKESTDKVEKTPAEPKRAPKKLENRGKQAQPTLSSHVTELFYPFGFSTRMANFITQGIVGYVGGYIDSMLAGAVKAGGGLAGDAAGAVGNGINAVGGSFEKGIRRYGDGAKDYGNSIKDWTSADGVRQPTAFNPLGLPDTGSGGKRGLSSMPGSMTSSYTPKSNSSPAYKAPSSTGTKSAVKPKPAQKALPAPAKGPAKKSTGTPAAKKKPAPATGKAATPSKPRTGSAIGTQKKPPMASAKKTPAAAKKPAKK